MRKNLIQDERALAQKRKIGSDTCKLLLGGLLISLLVQEYIFNAPFSQYAVEFICLFGAYIYIVIRNLIAGNDLYGAKNHGKKSVVVGSLLGGLTICVIAGITNYARYGEKYTDGTLFLITLAILFASGTFVTFLGYSLTHLLNQKRQKKLAEELDKDENDIE